MPTGKDSRANAILDAIYGGGRAAGFPATVYLAAYYVAPSKSGGGTYASYGSYARVAITNDTTHWPAAANRQKTNALRISFPTPTTDTSPIVALGIHGHATNDDLIHFLVLGDPISALSGEPLYVEAGDLIITVP